MEMKSKLLPEVQSLLETLLSKAEQPNHQQVIRVLLNKGIHPWYFSGQVLGLRASVNEQLEDLATQGLLKLRWQKYKEGKFLFAVCLADKREETIEILYQLLDRISARRMRIELLNLLENQQTNGGMVRTFYYSGNISTSERELLIIA